MFKQIVKDYALVSSVPEGNDHFTGNSCAVKAMAVQLFDDLATVLT